MFDQRLEQFLESIIFQTFGRPDQIESIQYVGGGCINNTLRVDTESGQYFVKWNESESQDMFDKESKGLEIMRNTGIVSVPTVHQTGTAEGRHYLIMDFIQSSAPAANFWEALGHGLAHMHQHTSENYGLDHDNYIGRLPQKNTFQSNWIDFFIENRLEVQLGLGIYNNYITKDFAKKFRLLYAQLPGLLTDEPPALLHGDLWSGNFMVGPDGNPYLIDPAVYYGHREIEIAFTKLFGGFDQAFYHAYEEMLPLQPGFPERSEIYNLYPLLVHVNLFGTSYLNGVERVIKKYC